MKQLGVIKALAESIEAATDRVIAARVNANHSHLATASESGTMDSTDLEDPLDALKVKVAELNARLQQMARPPLTDITREHTLVAIMQGLSGLGSESAARVATHTYGAAWFDAEPDPLLRQQLAEALLEKYGDSPSANYTLWRKYS